MTAVTLEQIEHLAHLARLKLSDEQKASLVGDFESILWLIGQLDEVDVEGVERTWFDHIQHTMEPRKGVQGCDDASHMMKNVTHPLDNNGIVVKSSIK